jgi:hypothetical protein
MRAVLKRIQFEVIFAILVVIGIPIFLLMTYWNVTIDMFKKAPSELEKIVRSYVYGD